VRGLPGPTRGTQIAVSTGSNCRESPRCPAVMTIDMGFLPCSKARRSFVVKPPREVCDTRSLRATSGTGTPSANQPAGRRPPYQLTLRPPRRGQPTSVGIPHYPGLRRQPPKITPSPRQNDEAPATSARAVSVHQ